MKKFALFFVVTTAFLAAPFVTPRVVAAPASFQSKIQWPTFKQTSSKKNVPEVKAIQFLLRSRGFYKSQPDGVFGAQTVAAVKDFQRSKGLKADGVVGSRTFPKLVRVVKRGDRGDAVRAAQIFLRETTNHVAEPMFADLKVDGIFGFETERAVRANQRESSSMRDSSLPKVDGVIGIVTWAVLFGSELPWNV